jgi:hypothetical protein
MSTATLEQLAGNVLVLAEAKRRADHDLRLARMNLEQRERDARQAAEDLERARASYRR